MPKGGVCAEVGVFKGDYSLDILRVTRPRELHLIDPWWTVADTYDHTWVAGADWYGQQGVPDTRSAFERVERLAAQHPECVVHVGRSQDVLPKFADGYFDWVYLDSSHNYDDTVEELELLRVKVRQGGVIAGHDYGFPGVRRAIGEFCERYGWRLGPVDLFDQWAIRPA
jgi:hypothetical protein